jgi:hypothetical protein
VRSDPIKRKIRILILFAGLLHTITYDASCRNYSFIEYQVMDELPDSVKNTKDLLLYGYYQHGWVLPTNQFVNGNNINQKPISQYRAASVQLSFQTSGDKLWEQLYNFPRYGFGFYKPFFPDAPYLGNPVAMYGTVGFTLKRWEGLSLNFDIGLGLAFNWKSYLEDEFNLAMGASKSSIFSTTFSLERRLSNGLGFYAGAGFVHFSNGSLKVPNLGINVFTPKAGVSYNLTRPENEYRYQLVPEYQRRAEIFISAFTGWRNILYYGTDVDSLTRRKGVYYSCYGISAAYNYQVSHKSKFGFGIMADYFGYVNSSITSDNGRLLAHPASLSEGFQISIYPSYELVMNRASLVVQPGFYVYRAKYPERTPFNYQRIGMKYNVSGDLSMGLYMRAHYWSIADFIEWTIGYRID